LILKEDNALTDEGWNKRAGSSGLPFAGIIQFRFKGYNLSPAGHPQILIKGKAPDQKCQTDYLWYRAEPPVVFSRVRASFNRYG
jgi:hypothetical protein